MLYHLSHCVKTSAQEKRRPQDVAVALISEPAALAALYVAWQLDRDVQSLSCYLCSPHSLSPGVITSWTLYNSVRQLVEQSHHTVCSVIITTDYSSESPYLYESNLNTGFKMVGSG